jgi:ubiquinone/menaquinone biosynthesis C-methylase UbiE
MNAREYEIMYQVEDEHWWYVGMRRLVLSTLTRLHRAQGCPPWLILDAGCGTGAIAARLKQFGRVVAVDLSNLALHFSHRRGLGGYLSQGSVTAVPAATNTFDSIISLDVLCSVPDDNQALAEFYRVLKPGGLALLNLPALEWLRGQHDLAVNILHRYAPQKLQAQLSQHGFVIERISFANSLLLPVVAPYRLATNWLPVTNQPKSDVYPVPKLLNAVLGWVMGLEAGLIPRVSLPLGMSLFVVARKKTD